MKRLRSSPSRRRRALALLLLLPLLGGCVMEREIYRESWTSAPSGGYVLDEVVRGGGPAIHGGGFSAGYWNHGYDPFWYLGSTFLTGYGYVPSYYSTYAGYPFYIDYFWHYPVYAVVSRPWVHVYRPRYPLYSPPVYRPPARPDHRPGLGAAAGEAVRLANRPPGTARPRGATARVPGDRGAGRSGAAAREAARFSGGAPETGSSAGRGHGSWQPVSGPVRNTTTRPAGPRADRPEAGIPLPRTRPGGSRGPGAPIGTRSIGESAVRALPRPAPVRASPPGSRALPASTVPRTRPATRIDSRPSRALSRPTVRPTPSTLPRAMPTTGAASRPTRPPSRPTVRPAPSRALAPRAPSRSMPPVRSRPVSPSSRAGNLGRSGPATPRAAPRMERPRRP